MPTQRRISNIRMTLVALAGTLITLSLVVINWRPTPTHTARRIVITEKGANQNHQIKLNDEILIQLPTTPSQRYMWYLAETSVVFTELRPSRFEAIAPEGEPGAAEVQTFDFRAVARGEHQLRFYLGTPKITLKTITFRFEIQ